MKIASVDYAAPTSVEEAIRILAENEGAKIISGGQSLMPMLAFRIAAPSLLVDLKNINGMQDIEISATGVRLGARVRWVDIEKDVRLRSAHPLLAEAIAHVAHYQVRNRGTVGGSIAHADPSAEMPGVAVACDAQVEIHSPRGARDVPIDEFLQGALQTCLEEDEIITSVRLPAWDPPRRWAFEEFALRRGDFAMAGVLLHYTLDSINRTSDVHIAAIGVNDRALRLTTAEQLLEGRVLTDESVAAVTAAACEALEPMEDLHASSDYRRALFGTLLLRALKRSRNN
jgi:aerobic carbon-monoxide dehydrogenase medium subunit